MGEDKKLVKKEGGEEIKVNPKANVMDLMADSWNVDKENFKRILKSTVMKPVKVKGGKQGEMRPVTEEELYAFVLVCKEYDLNPLLKEIYAYADKSGGIIPVVGIDGWIKLGTRHPEYRSHNFNYPPDDKMITIKKSKTCYPWMECVVERYVLDEKGKRVERNITMPDGSKTMAYEVVTTKHREYLDECYNGSEWSNPWDTHTKRFLGWKTLIQTFREAFGFSGIKDDDEARRIVEERDNELNPGSGNDDNNFMPKVKGGKKILDEKNDLPANEVIIDTKIPEADINDDSDIESKIVKEKPNGSVSTSRVKELKQLMKIMFGEDLLKIGKKIKEFSGKTKFEDLDEAEASVIIEGITSESSTVTK